MSCAAKMDLLPWHHEIQWCGSEREADHRELKPSGTALYSFMQTSQNTNQLRIQLFVHGIEATFCRRRPSTKAAVLLARLDAS